jgi:hypothetical protein
MTTALLLYCISHYLLVHYTTEPQKGMYKQETKSQKMKIEEIPFLYWNSAGGEAGTSNTDSPFPNVWPSV